MDGFIRTWAISRLEDERPSHIVKDLGVRPSSTTRLRKKVVDLGRDRAVKNRSGQDMKNKASVADVKAIL